LLSAICIFVFFAQCHLLCQIKWHLAEKKNPLSEEERTIQVT